MGFRGILFDSINTDLGQAAEIEAIGGTWTSNEAISIGSIVAILSSIPDRIVRAQTTDATRRNVIGIAIDAAAGAGERVRVAMFGRCPACQVAPGVVEGQILYSTATLGQAGAAVANSRAIGTAQGGELAGIAPVWASPAGIS